MDKSTKARIIEIAIKRFNHDGLANVPMQQIAEDLNMSAGNLAYHFRTKNDLINVIFDQIALEAEDTMKQFRVYPNLLDFDLQLNRYFDINQRLPFYFRDILELDRHFPHLMEKRKLIIEKYMAQIASRFAYNYKRGIIKEEHHEGQYKDMAETVWMISTFFATKVDLLNEHAPRMDKKEFMRKIWNYIMPYFTEKGYQEYLLLIHPLISNPSQEY